MNWFQLFMVSFMIVVVVMLISVYIHNRRDDRGECFSSHTCDQCPAFCRKDCPFDKYPLEDRKDGSHIKNPKE